MKQAAVISGAILSVLIVAAAVGAVPVDNLVVNGTFDGDGAPWAFFGRAEEVGVIPEDLVDLLGNPFAYLTNSGRGFLRGAYAVQKVAIPTGADKLYLDFDYGFYEQGDATADDIDYRGLVKDTAFFGVGLFGGIFGLSVVATESTFEFLPPSYEQILNAHFTGSFDVRHAAGGSACLVFGTVSLSRDIFAVSAIDNITLATQRPIPEPATLLLLGAGCIGLAAAGRRRICIR